MDSGKQRLYRAVAQTIIERIEHGDYPAGTRLPGERELAEELKVSRVTIREAEIALEAQGYIVVKTGSGVYVRKDRNVEQKPLPDVTAFELTTARSVIEAEAAALAAVNISDAELSELERLIGAMAGEEAGTAPVAEDLDQAFHMTIARATGNPTISFLVEQMWRMRNELPRVREIYASVCDVHARSRAAEHRTIFEALERRDSNAARTAMRDHFHRLFESMMTAREDAALAELRRSLGEDRQRFLKATLL